MKGFIAEFKKFIMRGNVIDLAVGVIIGGAFQAIVNSLVNDIISPVLSLATKGINLADKFIVLTTEEVSFATVEAAKEAGYATLSYGSFITAVINFLIMAFVIFLIVKGINKISDLGKKKEEEEPEEPTTKVCPFCKSEISIDAVKCPHCTSDIPEEETDEEKK
ncbi:MAG: large conductance mechanosensitive channel protein MscL [Oscillospiraceae bacterium]|nr:large conductance mechanosensitive channel protein MscL [Oscillospiraceae bacterium]MDD6145792.1 large conductance mechanosensitive channel protein MscL [Oscillospiraceae bacterium]